MDSLCDMKKEKRLDHAKHNEEICKIIHEKGGFSDWVITTSFYCALHYVSYKIFPLKDITSNGNQFEIKTLDEYYRFKQLDCGKHVALSDLVYTHLPAISPDYDWLMSLCLKARYQNYQLNVQDEERALKLLEAIKKELGITT